MIDLPVPSHRRAKWIITRSFNLKPKRRKRDAAELTRLLVELDRYFMYWLRKSRVAKGMPLLSQYDAIVKAGAPLVGDQPLPVWAMDTLLALCKWAP